MVDETITEDREHPFGELPSPILSIIQNYVEYSERYFDCEEISGNGKSILNLREKWKKCNNASSKFDLFNKIHQYGSKWYHEFDSHIEKSVWFSRIVPDMFRNMFNQMHKKVKKLIHLAPDSLIQKYPNLLNWAESNKQLNVKVKALEGLDSLLNNNKNKEGLRLSDVSELFNTLKKYRNAVEHRNDFLIPSKFEQSTCISNLENYFEAISINPLRLREIVKRFLKIVSLNEKYADLHEEKYLNYYQTTIERRNFLQETDTTFVRSLLDLKEWKEYINALGINNRNKQDVAIDMLISYFDEGAQLVEITGRGGVGKTALTHEFIRRISNKYIKTNLSYDKILFITSKSKKQGEYAATRAQLESGVKLLNPHNPRRGLAQNFIERADYHSFLARICKLTRNQRGPLEEQAQQILMDNKYLVIVDNFEDVTDPNQLEQYDRFFRKVTKGDSNIIITTRDIPRYQNSIALQNFDYPNAMKFLRARYEFMLKQTRSSDTKLLAYRQQDYDMISESESNLLEVVKHGIPSDVRHHYDASMTHPKALSLLVDLLFSPKIREKLRIQPNNNLIDYIREIATHPDIKFTEYIDDLMEWSIEKSYEQLIKTDENCMAILKFLILAETPLSKKQIMEKFQKEGKDPKKVNDGIHALLTRDGDYLIDTEEKETYELSPITRAWLENRREFEKSTKPRKQFESKEKQKLQNKLWIEDESSLEELHQMVFDGQIEDFKHSIVLCDWFKVSRNTYNLQNLNIALSILNTINRTGQDLAEEREVIVEKLNSVLFKCLRDDEPSNVYHSMDINASMNDILEISLNVIARHETKTESKKQWIIYAASDLVRDGHTLIQDDRELIFDKLFRNQNLFPYSTDNDDYIFSWLRFVSLFEEWGFYGSQNFTISRATLEVIKSLDSMYKNQNKNLAEEEIPKILDTGAQEKIASFVERWTSFDEEWQESSRQIRNSFDVGSGKDNFFEKSSGWNMYTRLPKLTIEIINSLPYSFEIFELDGVTKVDILPNMDYYVLLEKIDTDNHPPQMITRCVEKLEQLNPKSDLGTTSNEQNELIHKCKQLIIAGIKSSVHSIYTHSDLKQDYYEKTQTNLEAAVREIRSDNNLSNSRDFVSNFVVGEFKRIKVRKEGLAGQSYVRYVAHDDDDGFGEEMINSRLDEIQQEQQARVFIFTTNSWIEMSYKGLVNFLGDENENSLSRCIDNACKPTQLRIINKEYPGEFNLLKETFQQLINDGITAPIEIVREALVNLGCEETKISDAIARIEVD